MYMNVYNKVFTCRNPFLNQVGFFAGLLKRSTLTFTASRNPFLNQVGFFSPSCK